MIDVKSDICVCVFFFSSRRRHTRCSRDWSSDVCSSDLTHHIADFRARGSCALHTRQPQLHFSGLDVLQCILSPSRHNPFRQVAGIRFFGGVRNPYVAVEQLPLTKMRSEEHTSELQSRLHLVC